MTHQEKRAGVILFILCIAAAIIVPLVISKHTTVYASSKYESYTSHCVDGTLYVFIRRSGTPTTMVATVDKDGKPQVCQ